MNDIRNLMPKALWKNFYSLTQIPRPSKHESAVVDFVKEFAKKLNLETLVDEVGNVVIKKPATTGMENRKGIILQGHLDMVPQKNSDKAHDFTKDPIEAIISEEWVVANGTTLGADNGIGVAAAMAVLEATDLQHGPIEALFTIDEETGMTGAFNLKKGMLDGDILLNLDSEDEGELYVGCAGGVDANIKMKYNEVAVQSGMKAYKLALTGLKGGHSGLDIALGRGNSNKLLNRYLKHAFDVHGLRIVSINGGNLRNAIPRESFAEVVVPEQKAANFEACVKKYEEIYKKELSVTEPQLVFAAEAIDCPQTMIDETSQLNLIRAVYACPNGMMRMSDSMAGLVETSTNLAIIRSEKGTFTINCLLRSSVDSAKADLGEMVKSTFELAGAEVRLEGEYPGWKPNMDSAILKSMQNVYQSLYGKIPEIKGIHAGLECGLLGGVYPHWDMISFGPTIRFPHSPDEKVKIDTVDKFWKFLVETLKNAPLK